MGAGCVDELDEGGARCDEKIGLLPCDPPRDVAAVDFNNVEPELRKRLYEMVEGRRVRVDVEVRRESVDERNRDLLRFRLRGRGSAEGGRGCPGKGEGGDETERI